MQSLNQHLSAQSRIEPDDLNTANCSGDADCGIAELAAHFGITTRAIRFYETKGLISPRRVSGARVFSVYDKDRLARVLLAKRLGFSLNDIKVVQMVADGSVNDPKELVEHKENFEFVIKKLKTQRKDIDVLTKDMQALCSAIETHVENLKEDGSSVVFQFANAYEAKFRQSMDEDFLPL